MNTKILDISALNIETIRRAQVLCEPQAIAETEAALERVREAADILANGGLVAFPTETVYGLGANAFDEDAVRRVYAAKGRPSDNPMIVHIARASDIGQLTNVITPDSVRLADRFWPGPLTMVFKKSAAVPDVVTGGLDTVAVRLPDHPAAVEFIRAAAVPVAAPSANISGKPSPTKAEHVIRDLGGKVDCILVGDDCRIGIESTVVDLTADTPTVLRPGIISAYDLSVALGREVAEAADEENVCAKTTQKEPSPLCREVAEAVDSSCGADVADALEMVRESPQMEENSIKGENAHEANIENPHAEDSPCLEKNRSPATQKEPSPLCPRSPGMKYTHYAPKAEMILIEGSQENVRREAERLKTMNEALGRSVVVLLYDESAADAARGYYAKLRELDDTDADLIIVGAIPDTDGAGFALMNRMRKSAGGRLIYV
jgi:tRNA threonylcarbamoyl adenosine modification protein (Sua5/YciO/YrdC/YwlC family)